LQTSSSKTANPPMSLSSATPGPTPTRLFLLLHQHPPRYSAPAWRSLFNPFRKRNTFFPQALFLPASCEMPRRLRCPSFAPVTLRFFNSARLSDLRLTNQEESQGLLGVWHSRPSSGCLEACKSLQFPDVTSSSRSNARPLFARFFFLSGESLPILRSIAFHSDGS